MATSRIAVTEGTGKNVATNSISEDAVTKEIGRQVLNNSAGTEIGTSAAPVEMNLRSSTVGIATSAKQDTGNTSLGTIDTSTAAAAAGTGTTTDAAATAGSTGSLSAKQRLMTSQLDAIKTSVETIDNIVSGAGINITQVGGATISQGHGTAAAAIRVELPTDGTGVVGISDGTNTANVVKADGTAAAQAALITAPSRLEVAFTTTIAQAVASTDVSNYRMVSVHTVTQGGSSTVSFQISNDNTNWVSIALNGSTSVGGSSPTMSTGGVGVVHSGPITARYFRLNVTGIVSGTTAGVVEFFSEGAVAIGGMFVGAMGVSTSGPQKIEDVASANGDAGIAVFGIRQDTPVANANVSASGDYLPLIADNFGKLWTASDGISGATIPLNNANLGAQAVSSENAAVTTARQVQLVADLVGKLIVLPYANPENFVSGAITSAMTGTTSTSLIAAPAAGLRNYITQITVSNSHATVGTDIIIQDGSGGTTLYTAPAAAVYGGAVLTFPTPLRQPTTATAIFCANVTTGASTKVSASGYKGA